MLEGEAGRGEGSMEGQQSTRRRTLLVLPRVQTGLEQLGERGDVCSHDESSTAVERGGKRGKRGSRGREMEGKDQSWVRRRAAANVCLPAAGRLLARSCTCTTATNPRFSSCSHSSTASQADSPSRFVLALPVPGQHERTAVAPAVTASRLSAASLHPGRRCRPRPRPRPLA
jgi:hypothetical protein